MRASLLCLCLGTSRAASRSSSEAYASILYAPPAADPVNHKRWQGKKLALTCVAAATGSVLRHVDPDRDRVMIANADLAQDARTMARLKASWRVDVKNMSYPDPTGRNRPFSFPHWETDVDPAALPPWTLHDKEKRLNNAEILGRKNHLWNLSRPGGDPYERVFFVDADILFLQNEHRKGGLERHLKHMWRRERGTLWASKTGKTTTCFSGGWVLLEPNRTDFELLQKCLWDPSLLPTLAHCPGHDQRILNSVFYGRWTQMPEMHALSADAGLSNYKKGYNFLHFHNREASPFVAGLWQSLMRSAVIPDRVRKDCAKLYRVTRHPVIRGGKLKAWKIAAEEARQQNDTKYFGPERLDRAFQRDFDAARQRGIEAARAWKREHPEGASPAGVLFPKGS